MDFINRHSGININDAALVKNNIGFDWNDFLDICSIHVPMGYITCNGSTIEGTEKLFETFSENGEERFEEFWKISPKGNKQKAKIQFNKCIKLITYEELKTAYIKYLASVNDKQYQQHVATWLNPEMKHWEDVYQLEEKKTDNKLKSFFDGKTPTIR